MTILYVLSGSSMSDGSTKSFLRLLHGVINQGHICAVVCSGKIGVYEYLQKHDIKTYYLKYRFNAVDISFNKPLNYIKWIRRNYINTLATKDLINICRVFKPDLIHTNSSIINIGYLTAKKIGIPHITHFREYGDLDFRKKIHKIKSQISNPYNYSIAITKDIFNYRKLNKDRDKVIYNGICQKDDFKFFPLKEAYILYAARVEKTKGIEDVVISYIEYCKKVSNPLKLKIAGSFFTPERENLKNKLSVLLSYNYLEKNVEWLGERKDTNLLMSKAYVTVIASYNEGFGRVTAEALANGSLVIGRDTAGTKEQLDNGLSMTGQEIGLRFKTIKELTNCFIEITNNGIERYFDMIQAGQFAVSNLYTIDKYVQSVLNLYYELLHKK